MTRAGIIAVIFAVVAVVATYIAVQNRDMSSPGFILAAYGIVAVVLAMYVWSLTARLRDARSRSEDVGGGEGP